MTLRRKIRHPAWWTVALLSFLTAMVFLSMTLFLGTFHDYARVTVTSERSGLVMEPGAKVKIRGIQVGRVSAVDQQAGAARLSLDLDRDQLAYIPANVQAQIRATTAFGAKYVDLVVPAKPSKARLSAGATIAAQNVSTEVNTVFQSLMSVLSQIQPEKLNSVLTALSEGLRGQGPRIGEATTAANEVLMALNPRADTLNRNWQRFGQVSSTYGAAAQDILKILDRLSTTSVTIADHASDLDVLLANTIGFSRSGVDLLAPSMDNFVTAVSSLESTTRLLLKYNPEYTCLLQGAKFYLDNGATQSAGGNGYSVILDTAILLGDDPYRYPENLPVLGAKGGPGGKPGCGSLPDVAKNWPVRQMVTNTGWGTGMDWRPNPGIGFPGYANYLPVTRAVPEPPSIRYPGGPAPGPIPYPGAPPYGAPLYAPDGTPLYPGLPPAPPPGAPREPGPTPGAEPFTVHAPAGMQPTPTPPLPEQAAPSP